MKKKNQNKIQTQQTKGKEERGKVTHLKIKKSSDFPGKQKNPIESAKKK